MPPSTPRLVAGASVAFFLISAIGVTISRDQDRADMRVAVTKVKNVSVHIMKNSLNSRQMNIINFNHRTLHLHFKVQLQLMMKQLIILQHHFLLKLHINHINLLQHNLKYNNHINHTNHINLQNNLINHINHYKQNKILLFNKRNKYKTIINFHHISTP
eukprot:UN02597